MWEFLILIPRISLVCLCFPTQFISHYQKRKKQQFLTCLVVKWSINSTSEQLTYWLPPTTHPSQGLTWACFRALKYDQALFSEANSPSGDSLSKSRQVSFTKHLPMNCFRYEIAKFLASWSLMKTRKYFSWTKGTCLPETLHSVLGVVIFVGCFRCNKHSHVLAPNQWLICFWLVRELPRLVQT